MKNRTAVRMAICGCLCAFALVSAASAAFSRVSGSGEAEGYILRDCMGLVAVYGSSKPNRTLTVTDIETASLPELDRQELETGIRVSTHEELLQLLEDFGS